MGLWEILKGEQPGLINTILHYQNKGQFGEYSTEFALTNNNLDGRFSVHRNVYIPYKNGTCEIDLLMFHERGIFVFESKNYSGWIFGSTEELYWTQTFQNGERFRFYNPIKQNNTHIKALSAFLNLPEDVFSSYIIFSERCTLMRIPYPTSSTVVLRRPDMLDYLRQDLSMRVICYSPSEIEVFSGAIQNCTNISEEEKFRHAEEARNVADGNTCPFCGQPLILRHGRYGDFIGCSAYPKCKFTRKRYY